MSTTINNTNHIYSDKSMINRFPNIENWFTLFNKKASTAITKYNSKLNAEIHIAITKQPSTYVASICGHLFTLYHDMQHRPFVLQFLPSFIIAYYDILYHHHHSETIDVTTKDVCSTIDTFLLSLYNLDVTDNGPNKSIYEFRIPNLMNTSIYHIPNFDYYAPTPLTQQAISKHESKCDTIRLQSFTPFDNFNEGKREQILWYLLIRYGGNICFMDEYSRKSYIEMSKKLLGQGFTFTEDRLKKTTSILPATGRRIQISSRIMSEILGSLLYLKSNSSDNEALDCMILLKKRAEYEMYSDVLLMTESMEYLHEFEIKKSYRQDNLGIEIETPPTVELIRQKRMATTAFSTKNRRNSEHKNSDTDTNVSSSPIIAQGRTHISSSIGLATSAESHSNDRIATVRFPQRVEETYL